MPRADDKHSTSDKELANAPEAPALEFEGDYRPTEESVSVDPQIRVDPPHVDFLYRIADALNTTLDLQTLMLRVADLVRAVVDYRIFAILLVNDRSQELWMRFQVGHAPELERLRIKIGKGIVGQAAAERRSIRVDDVSKVENYIHTNPEVQSELAIPLVVKNKSIGVLDLESVQLAAFTEDHQRLLELVASRMAVAIENARLYTKVSRQAQTLTVLNEISRELTSILDLDGLLERIHRPEDRIQGAVCEAEQLVRPRALGSGQPLAQRGPGERHHLTIFEVVVRLLRAAQRGALDRLRACDRRRRETRQQGESAEVPGHAAHSGSRV